MKIKQYEIWTADLNPRFGTETGKTRPVLVIQTDLLNRVHLSTIICPITTNVTNESELLRVHLKKGMSNLKSDCDIMMDQIRAVDKKRLIKKFGKLSSDLAKGVKENLLIILDLESHVSR